MSEATDVEIDAALARGRAAQLAEPRAAGARYDRASGRVVVELTNGCTFAFPARLAQGLERATDEQLAAVEILGAGLARRLARHGRLDGRARRTRDVAGQGRGRARQRQEGRAPAGIGAELSTDPGAAAERPAVERSELETAAQTRRGPKRADARSDRPHPGARRAGRSPARRSGRGAERSSQSALRRDQIRLKLCPSSASTREA